MQLTRTAHLFQTNVQIAEREDLLCRSLMLQWRSISSSHFSPNCYRRRYYFFSIIMVTSTSQVQALRLLSEVHNLCKEIERLLLNPPRDQFPRMGDDNEDLLNYKVELTTGRASMRGLTGKVVDRRGSKYWWVRLDNGSKVYRKAHTLVLLSGPAVNMGDS